MYKERGTHTHAESGTHIERHTHAREALWQQQFVIYGAKSALKHSRSQSSASSCCESEREGENGGQYGYVFNSADNKALAAKPLPTPTVQNVSSKMENGKWQRRQQAARNRSACKAISRTATARKQGVGVEGVLRV